MNDRRSPTHRHKRVGDVVLLRSTAELAEVLTSTSGERFWVKLTELTELVDSGDQPRQRRRSQPPSAPLPGRAGCEKRPVREMRGPENHHRAPRMPPPRTERTRPGVGIRSTIAIKASPLTDSNR